MTHRGKTFYLALKKNLCTAIFQLVKQNKVKSPSFILFYYLMPACRLIELELWPAVDPYSFCLKSADTCGCFFFAVVSAILCLTIPNVSRLHSHLHPVLDTIKDVR